ncbi:DUF6907 domain-containing protein [Streptomyces sp. Ac-502]|uniref:DUF6907 domain-containing protein n=1 Tax=Streptomyces sp. Ac-502 TaxID=3342801 RepID=UPI00386271EF
MSVARHDIPADSADAPIPYSLTPAAEALPRLAATSVRGVPVHVPCPDWCVTDHAAEDLSFLEDVHHYGPRVQMSVPLYGGGTETVMVAHLALWPFAHDEDKGRAYLAIDPDGSGEVNSLYRDAALAFADQLAAHAADIRRLALQADPASCATR